MKLVHPSTLPIGSLVEWTTMFGEKFSGIIATDGRVIRTLPGDAIPKSYHFGNCTPEAVYEVDSFGNPK
jgi:hypothetical protein